jgi:hypothetical protein
MVRCTAVSTQALSLSERADGCLAALDDAGRAIARRVFLRLIAFGDDRPGAHRQQPVSALRGASDDPARLSEVLRQLTEAQLLTIGGDTASDDARVELADDALLASWPTLRTWIRTHGKPEQLRRQLESDADAWSQRADPAADPGDDRLLDKGQLGEIATWLTTDARREVGVSDVAEAFLTASQAAARRRWWPGRATVGTLLAILLPLVILATPFILLFIVVLSAWVIHKFG